VGGKSAGKRSRDIYQGGTFEQSKPTGTSGKSSNEKSPERQAKPSGVTAELRHGRHEPRRLVHSASLREGPAKTAREVRKPVGSQRRFREYSAARSSGPTSHRPSGGR
jgi:hypothetical protein